MTASQHTVEIVQVQSAAEIETVRALFLEYERDLGVDLCFQDFARELAGLPGAYAAPQGRLLLAYVDGAASGCVGLRGIAAGICEMKRLYVKPCCRGRGVGRGLVERVLTEAARAGYATMRLDTLDRLTEAVSLYRSFGFHEIPPYNDHGIPGTVFLEFDLQSGSTGARPGAVADPRSKT